MQQFLIKSGLILLFPMAVLIQCVLWPSIWVIYYGWVNSPFWHNVRAGWINSVHLCFPDKKPK